MDLGSSIIGIILLVISILPILLISIIRKKREKEILQSLTKIANKQNCKIDKYEVGNDFVVGIDETGKFVFFFRNTKDKIIERAVNLVEIQQCKVLNTKRVLKNKDENQILIDRLELCFIPKSRSKPEIKIEIFNSDESIQLNGELILIEKWSKIINNCIDK